MLGPRDEAPGLRSLTASPLWCPALNPSLPTGRHKTKRWMAPGRKAHTPARTNARDCQSKRRPLSPAVVKMSRGGANGGAIPAHPPSREAALSNACFPLPPPRPPPGSCRVEVHQSLLCERKSTVMRIHRTFPPVQASICFSPRLSLSN